MHQQFLVDNQYRRWVIPCRYSITVKDEYAIQNRLEIRNTLSQVSLGYIHDYKFISKASGFRYQLPIGSGGIYISRLLYRNRRSLG